MMSSLFKICINMFLLILIDLLVPSYPFTIPEDYNYEDAANWPKQYSTCAGKRQSPIDINSKALKPSNGLKDWRPLQFLDDDKAPSSATLVNDGHGLKLHFKWPARPQSVTDGPLFDRYYLEELHFHWPSEHTWEGKSYPLEIRYVYYNRCYKTLENALNHEDGIAAVAAFFEPGEESEALSIILENVSNVTEPGSMANVSPFSLDKFIPKDSDHYFLTYNGSLTHPPCPEIITWLLWGDLLYASEEQLNTIVSVHLDNGDDHNNRPVQSLNDRTIWIVASDRAVSKRVSGRVWLD